MFPTLQESILRKDMDELNHKEFHPVLMGNLQNAIVDTKRQYEAIDRALEVSPYS